MDELESLVEPEWLDWYLLTPQERSAFLDSISRSAPVALAVYNAGTDVLAGDALGGMELSLDDVLARDQFVLRALRNRKIPTVVLTSGGYSHISYRAIARTIIAEAQVRQP